MKRSSGLIKISEESQIEKLLLSNDTIVCTCKNGGGRIGIDKNFKIIYSDFNFNQYKKGEIINTDILLNKFINHFKMEENKCIRLKRK